MKTLLLLILSALTITVMLGSLGSGSMTSPAVTCINEFPHERLTVHYHPTSTQFTLADLKYALDHKVHAAEIDLHLRESDGQVVCNHDSATPESPTLKAALDAVFGREGGADTVNHDGKQFFIVLEPKEKSDRLFEGIIRVLSDYKAFLSTSVGPKDRPRGVTVVITGAYPREFYAHFPRETINRLCIVEGHDYSGEIANASKHKTVFQWVSIRHSKTPGADAARVQAFHSGTDPKIPGRFNVRIWDCHADLPSSIESCADSLNCDRDEIQLLQRLLVKL